MNTFSFRKPFVFSVILHAIILILLVMHLSSSKMRQLPLQPDVNIIKAVAVNPTEVESQITQMRAIEQKEQQAIQKEAEKQQASQEAVKQKAAQAAAEKVEAAKQKTAQIIAQKTAEAAKLFAQQQAAAKAIQAKATQVKASKIKAAQSKKATEEKTKQDMLKTQQTTLNAQKKQQQQKAAQALKLAQQKALANQIAAEQKQLEAARTKEQQTEIEKFTALILHTMRQNWIVPEGVNPDISCQLAIQLNGDGTVISVTLVRSSGSAALDNSARMAVFRSSPLPVPADPDLFKQVFHEFNLTVSPKDIQE